MVQGLDALNRRWGAIPGKVRAAAREALEDVAEDLVRQMRAAAPKGATGKLAKSIGWTWGDAPDGSMLIGTVAGSKRDYATMRITIYAGGGDAFYARFQEFGTVKMAANPFFYPVWRARKRGADDGVADADVIAAATRSPRPRPPSPLRVAGRTQGAPTGRLPGLGA